MSPFDLDLVLVSQIPSQTWLEGFVVRPGPGGRILATRLDEPELYTWDGEDPEAVPRLLHTFPRASGLISLCALPAWSPGGGDEEYVVMSGVLDAGRGAFDKLALWRVTLSGDDDVVRADKVVDLVDVGMSLGIAPATDTVMLVADSDRACIWTVDLVSRRTAIWLADAEIMRPAGGSAYSGISRLRVVGDSVWFTNTSRGLLARVPFTVCPATGEVRVAGPARVVAGGLSHCDGLAVAADGSFAYTASYHDGLLMGIDIDPATGAGGVPAAMDHLVNPTAVELVAAADGRRRLFVICSGEIELDWVTDRERSPWAGLEDLNSAVTISITMTTEVIDV